MNLGAFRELVSKQCLNGWMMEQIFDITSIHIWVHQGGHGPWVMRDIYNRLKLGYSFVVSNLYIAFILLKVDTWIVNPLMGLLFTHCRMA